MKSSESAPRSHPDWEGLERHAAGESDPETDAHLRQCADCRRKLDEVDANLAAMSVVRRTVQHAAQPELGSRRSVGRYRLLREVGRGGMGIVYEAEQENTRRKVAVKILRSDSTSKDVALRFQAEGEILGRLSHAGIAQVLDAGVAPSPDGPIPFLAMEFVEGKTLLRYADEHGLGTRARLALMVKVCDAVHHAHERNVVHRDLKPGNIVVSRDPAGGREGTPKVLDFGVARLTGMDLRVTLQTHPGQLLGTLPYMSPEQVSGDPRAIDARSDVYALGIILFELLTGNLPYALPRNAVHEAVRIIRESDPRPPSSVNRELRGDVDTVVLKTLEKEPSRRYQSARELALELGRILSHEPITARPASTLYLLRKLAKRHRNVFASLSVVLASLVAGVAATSALWLQADAARQAAAMEADQATAVRDFLMKVIVQGAPDQRRKGSSIEEVFALAAERVDKDFADKPLARAELHSTIGWTLLRMQRLEEAEYHLRAGIELWREHLGEESLDFARALSALGQVELQRGNPVLAENLLRRAIALREALDEEPRLLGVNHGALGAALWAQQRGEEGNEHLREAVRLVRLDRGYVLDLAIMLGNYASRLGDSGRFQEAIDHAGEAVALVRGGGREAEDHLALVLRCEGEVFTASGDLTRGTRSLFEAAACERLELGGLSLPLTKELERLERALENRSQSADAPLAMLDCVRRAVAFALLGRDDEAGPAWEAAHGLAGDLSAADAVNASEELVDLARSGREAGLPVEEECASLFYDLDERVASAPPAVRAEFNAHLGEFLLTIEQDYEAKMLILESLEVIGEKDDEVEPVGEDVSDLLIRLYELLGQEEAALSVRARRDSGGL